MCLKSRGSSTCLSLNEHPMNKKQINIRRWLLAAIAMPALLASGQPSAETIPAPQNQLTVDVQFLGRGESRYGGMPAIPVVVDEEGYEIDDGKVPS